MILEDELRVYHAQVWEKSKEILSHDLDLPFLSVKKPADAFSDFFSNVGASLNLDSSAMINVPSVMYFAAPKADASLAMYWGGILIPEYCVGNDDPEVTKMGLVHEQVHEILRAKELVYGVSEIVAQFFPDAGMNLNVFTEYLAHIYAAKILDSEGVSLRDYLMAPVYTYDPRSVPEGANLSETPSQRLDWLEETFSEYDALTKDFDPVADVNKHLSIFFQQRKVPQNVVFQIYRGYKQIVDAKPVIQRRIVDGSWKSIGMD